MMIIFSLPILDFEFLFFLQHLPFSIQGGGSFFIFWVSNISFWKWMHGDQPWPFSLPSPHIEPSFLFLQRSDQTILLLDE